MPHLSTGTSPTPSSEGAQEGTRQEGHLGGQEQEAGGAMAEEPLPGDRGACPAPRAGESGSVSQFPSGTQALLWVEAASRFLEMKLSSSHALPLSPLSTGSVEDLHPGS